MSSRDQVTRMALDNQAFALMGRLHVALRRGSGRVTDIEYMRIDPAYCRHVLALAAGSESGDLRQIGIKLEAIFFGEDGLFVRAPSTPLLARAEPAMQALATLAPPHLPKEDGVAPELVASREAPPTAQAYVGRLR